MAVTPEMIAVELGRTAPAQDSTTYAQWDSWIKRATSEIERRAEKRGVAFNAIDPDAVDEVVLRAVTRLARGPADGAEQVSDQVSVDDGSRMQSRRYGARDRDSLIADQWWDIVGLAARRRAFTVHLGGRAGYR